MEKMVDPAFGIETTLTDDIPVVSVSGEIDLATAQQLRVSLLDRLGTGVVHDRRGSGPHDVR